MADVFVSYSRDDESRVLELAAKLRAAGVSLWIDQGGLDGATKWSEQIVNALESAKVLLLMVSESAVRSDNVAKEVVLISERKGHILPVYLEPTVIPPSLKYQLAGIQHIPYFKGEDAAANLQAILRSLERIGVVLTPVQDAKESIPAPDSGVRAAAAPAPALPSERGALAVMPFDNISPDKETDYFSDGLTEELIARLALVSEIELVSGGSTKQLRERKRDARTLGGELGARYVVGGTVRRFQDSVRITVQLIDVPVSRQIWGNTYKGKLDDIFDIQEQVAEQIAEALKLKLSVAEKVLLTKHQTANAQAYDLYLRGQDYLYRLTKRSLEYAIQLFERAIELDRRYAAAYAACSSAYGQMYQYFSRDDKYRNRAQELSFKALMYDSNLPEAYTAMGLSYFVWGKLEEASASSRKAIELAPDDFVAHWTLGRIHFTNGQFEEAYTLFRRVIELKPGFISGYADLKMTCDGLGRPEEARAALNQMLERLPNYILQNPDDSRMRMFYAVTLAEVGRKEDAIREGSNALEISPDDPMMLYNGACLHARLDEPQRALDLLRHAISKGQLNFGWMRHDPDFAKLRDNAEFIALTSGQKQPSAS